MRKAIFFILLFFLSYQLIYSTLSESPLFDEVAFAPFGYEFLVNHDFRYEPFSPPLTRELSAIPMLFDQNVIKDPVFFWPRMMVVIFAISLGIIVYFFAKRLYGINAGLFALFLYTFQPEILARGHYAMTDFITAFFIVLSVYLFIKFRNSLTIFKLIILGIVIGFAMSAKFTSLPYLMTAFTVLVILEKKEKILKMSFYKRNFKKFAVLTFAIFISLWSTYFFTWEPALGYRFDQNRLAVSLAKTNPLIKFGLEVPIPLGSYISTIKQNIRHNSTNDFVKESVFWGEYSRFSFNNYLLVPIFLIKTPIALLIFFIISLFIFAKEFLNLGLKKSKKIKVSIFQTLKRSFKNLDGKLVEKLTPLIVILVVFGITFFSTSLLVLRYILPVYPFLIIFSSQVVNTKSRYLIILITVLSAWYVLTLNRVFPHFISYTNEFIGSQNNAYKYIAEGNLDLGQGLVSLAKYQKENNIKNLQLAYFGTAQPSKYGIVYERINDRSVNDSKKPVPVDLENKIVAISATCWYFCGYYKNSAFKNLEPDEVVGGSILIFK